MKSSHRVLARFLSAKTTTNYATAERLIEAVQEPLRSLSAAVFYWNKATPEQLEVLTKKLSDAAKAAKSGLQLSAESERTQAYLKKLGPKIRGMFKMLDEYAKASSWEEMQPVIKGQGTKSSTPSEKFYEYGKLLLSYLGTLDAEPEAGFYVGPYSVTLFTSSRADWTDEKVSLLRNVLEKSVQVLSRVGLSSVAGGRVFAYPTRLLPAAANTGHSALASYGPSTDRINIAAGEDKELLHSLVHELGHRAYFRLVAGQGRTAWTQFFEDNQGAPDVDTLINDWESFVANPPKSMDYSGERPKYSPYFAKFLKETGQTEERMWLEILSAKLKLEEDFDAYTGKPKGKGPSGLDQLKQKKQEAKAFLYPVSAYSTASSEELFAETFAAWALDGPSGIHELVRDAFKRTLSGFKTASAKVVIRPEGWRAANDVPDSWTRSGHLYRGMSEAEWRFIQSHKVVRSNESWSAAGEGTNFSDDARDAESYTNFGSTDPRRTGKPNYLIEVKKTDIFKRWSDGYWKAVEVPASLITRAWKMEAEGDEVVASLVHV